MGKRGSSLQKQERVKFILDCYSKGVKGTSDLFRFVSEEYPKISQRQFEYDLKDAKEEIKEYHAEDVDFMINDLTKHLWELYNKSLKIQDYRECRAIIKTISDITGAGAPKKIDHTTAGLPMLPYSDWTDEQIEHEIERLDIIRNKAQGSSPAP